jgi:hypothetical protein
MRAILRAILLVVVIGLFQANLLFPASADAEQGWKEEFEAVCSKTDAAMTLRTDELKDLVERCDRLKERIEAEEESTRKVYLRRLKSCRDLYHYMLEAREGK